MNTILKTFEMFGEREYKKYKVYRLIFFNDKCYIGMTSRPIKKRLKGHLDHFNDTKRNKYPLYFAMKKYNFKKIKVEILFQSDFFNEVNEMEKYYIKYFNSLSPNGYNIQSGGYKPPLKKRRGLSQSIETKNKISNSLKLYFLDKNTKEICKKAQNIASVKRRELALIQIKKAIIDLKQCNERISERAIAKKCGKSQFFVRHYKLKGVLIYE